MAICRASEPPGSYPLTFLIDGIEPPDREWRRASQADKVRYWSIAGIIAEKVKQDELQKGLDRHGRRLRPVRYRKVRFRRSGRVVDGEPLMPHRGLSRTRRLLQYTITSLGILFYWQSGWAKILDMHRRGACLTRGGRIVGKLPKRDVFGISPAGIDKVRTQALSYWRRGIMPDKKIHGAMQDTGIAIELPFDVTKPVIVRGDGKPKPLNATDFISGGVKTAIENASKAAKPMGEWDETDFRNAGIKVIKSTAKTRDVNTGTSSDGLKSTGFQIVLDRKKFKFAK
jgi:hypothetical protein